MKSRKEVKMKDNDKSQNYGFFNKIGRIINSGQSKTIALTGDIFDLFFSPKEKKYSPLLPFLFSEWDTPWINNRFIKVVYGLNEPIRFLNENDSKDVREAWLKMVLKSDDLFTAEARARDTFKTKTLEIEQRWTNFMKESQYNSRVALEFLRQLCLISRSKINGSPVLEKNLLIIVEGAEMLLPNAEIARLSELDRAKIAVCRDWFCDPEFTDGKDLAIFIAESKSNLNDQVSRLPQLLEVEVPSPDKIQRMAYASWFMKNHAGGENLKLWKDVEELASLNSPDVNGDGTVDSLDEAIVLGAFGECVDIADCNGDLNGDGVVDEKDVKVIEAFWGMDSFVLKNPDLLKKVKLKQFL